MSRADLANNQYSAGRPTRRHHQQGGGQGRDTGRAELPAGLQRAEQPVALPGAPRSAGGRDTRSTPTTSRSTRSWVSNAESIGRCGVRLSAARHRPIRDLSHIDARKESIVIVAVSVAEDPPHPARPARRRRRAAAPSVGRLAVRRADGALRPGAVRPSAPAGSADVGIRLAVAEWQPRRRTCRRTTTQAVSNRFFVDSVVFTMKYTVLATVLLIGLGLGLALLVQESTRWKVVATSGFPGAQRYGAGVGVPSLLRPLLSAGRALGSGHEPLRLVRSWARPNAALGSTLFLIVWRFAGFYMLLMLVGLQNIPVELYEAAWMDGASRWQSFRRITLPLLRPTLALSTVLCVTGSLLAFEQFYILTKGGPDNSTITIVAADLQRRLPGSERPRGCGGPLGDGRWWFWWWSTWSSCAPSAVRTRTEEHGELSRPAPDDPPSALSPSRSPAGSRAPPRTTIAGLALRTPYWVFTTALAVIFLFPVVWTAVSSVSPQAGTSQAKGWGFGNYDSLAHYQAGVWRYLANSLFVSGLTVAPHAGHLAARRLRVRPVPLPRHATRSSC